MTKGQRYKEVAVGAIDAQIADLQSRINELRESRELLLDEMGVNYSNSKGSNKKVKTRLGPGVPKKWVIETLNRYGSLMIGAIIAHIADNKGRKLNDTTVRRVLVNMQSAGQLRKLEDGQYKLSEAKPPPPLPPKNGDDDLPF